MIYHLFRYYVLVGVLSSVTSSPSKGTGAAILSVVVVVVVVVVGIPTYVYIYIYMYVCIYIYMRVSVMVSRTLSYMRVSPYKGTGAARRLGLRIV